MCQCDSLKAFGGSSSECVVVAPLLSHCTLKAFSATSCCTVGGECKCSFPAYLQGGHSDESGDARRLIVGCGGVGWVL